MAEDHFCSPQTLGKWPKNWAKSKYCCKAKHEDKDIPTDQGGGWSGATVKYSDLLEKKPAARKNQEENLSVPPNPASTVVAHQASEVSALPPHFPQAMQIDSPVIAHEVIRLDSPRRSPRKRKATSCPVAEPSAQRPAHDTLIQTWETDVFKFKNEIKGLKAEIFKLKKERGVLKRKLTMVEKKVLVLK